MNKQKVEEISFILKLSAIQEDVFQWNTSRAQTQFAHLTGFAKSGVTEGNLWTQLSHFGASKRAKLLGVSSVTKKIQLLQTCLVLFINVVMLLQQPPG